MDDRQKALEKISLVVRKLETRQAGGKNGNELISGSENVGW